MEQNWQSDLQHCLNDEICLSLAGQTALYLSAIILSSILLGVCLAYIWMRWQKRPDPAPSNEPQEPPIQSFARKQPPADGAKPRSEAGNVFFMLFGSVAMVGLLGAVTMQQLKGPVKTMAEVTKRTVAENTMIAGGRLGIVSATSIQPDSGDCDGDGFVEPLPWRVPALGEAVPTGGGLVPLEIAVGKRDPWGNDYGYCVWDHGSVTVSDDVIACGGNTAHRLEGGNLDTQYSLALISSGPDRVFQTDCNAWLDGNADNLPDVALIDKPAGSDDIVLGHTYAEAAVTAGGLWKLKSGEPGTASIEKDLDVSGGMQLSGALNLTTQGLILPDQTSTGACSEVNDQQLRRDTTTSPPTLQICDFNGSGEWEALGAGAAAPEDEECEEETGEQVVVFSTDGSHSFVVPDGVTEVGVKAWGAGGGGNGGGGGYVSGTISVSSGETLSISVGGGGAASRTAGTSAISPGGTGGNAASFVGAGGGGASGVRRSSTNLVVAPGGGGGSLNWAGGAGGGASGTAGSGNPFGSGGSGGTSSSGGAGGATNGVSGSASAGGAGGGGDRGGGGGGGGRYGGGGGSAGAATSDGGGGGGSALVPAGGSTTSGAGSAAGADSDPDYADNAGRGGMSGSANGNPGRVVIRYAVGGSGGSCGGGGSGGGASALDDLTDVDAPSPTDGQVLGWVDAHGMWKPVDAGGGSPFSCTVRSSGGATSSCNAGEILAGGGCQMASSGDNWLKSSYPSSATTWTCACRTNGGGGCSIQNTHAVCCTGGGGGGGGGSLPTCTDGQTLVYDNDSSTWGCGDAGGGGGGFTMSRQVFTNSGTYTPPANLAYAIVEVVGGGGGGSGGEASGSNGGGGGGGGGYAREILTAATIGASQTVTVGNGGTGGASGANFPAGTSGQPSSFGSLLSATGGAGAPGGGTAGGAGGMGSGGDINVGGGDGATASNSGRAGGTGGSSVLGGGGRSGSAGAGKAYGGGGGGGAAPNTGGAPNGAKGVVIVTEFISAAGGGGGGGGGSSLPTCTNGQMLKYDTGTSAWVCTSPALNDLANVNAASPTNDQVLTWNNTSSKWEAKTPSGGGTTLPTCTDGQTLVYDGDASAWSCGAGGGGTLSCVTRNNGSGGPVSCNAGETLVGGGCRWGNDDYLTDTYPSNATTWSCDGIDSGTSYAICCTILP